MAAMTGENSKPPRAIIKGTGRQARSKEQQRKDTDAAEREQAGAKAPHPGRGWTHGKKGKQ